MVHAVSFNKTSVFVPETVAPGSCRCQPGNVATERGQFRPLFLAISGLQMLLKTVALLP